MGGAAGSSPVDAGIPLHEGSPRREGPMGGIPLHDRTPPREGPMGGAAGSSPVDEEMQLDDESARKKVLTYTNPHPVALTSRGRIRLILPDYLLEGQVCIAHVLLAVLDQLVWLGLEALRVFGRPPHSHLSASPRSPSRMRDVCGVCVSCRRLPTSTHPAHKIRLTQSCRPSADIDWHSDAADAMFVSRNSGAGRPRAMCARPSATRSPTSCLGFASCSLPRESRTALAR